MKKPEYTPENKSLEPPENKALKPAKKKPKPKRKLPVNVQ